MQKTPYNERTGQYLEEIATPFVNYEDHKDLQRLHDDLRVVFSGYTYADIPGQIAFYSAVSIAIERCLGTDSSISQESPFYANGAVTREQKLEALLNALTHTPPLFDAAREGIAHFTRDIERNGFDEMVTDESDLPQLKTLWAYPSLRPTLQRLAQTLLDNLHETDDCLYLPEIIHAMEGTDCVRLVTPDDVKSYLNSSNNGKYVNDFKTLRATPHVWKIIEEMGPNFLCIRTPLSPHLTVGRSVNQAQADFYRTYYSGETNLMTIDFDSAAIHDITSTDQVNSSWMDDIDQSEWPGIYILLSHACEVLRGNRHGATTQHQPWIDLQVKHLLPCLMADIPALEQRMKNAGIDIPQVPTVAPEIGPGAISAVWQAHKAFIHGSP